MALTLEADAAVSLATTLDTLTSRVRETHKKRLQAQLGAPGGGQRSVDVSGGEIQAEAMKRAPPAITHSPCSR